jgi:diguanylate cyclase (GGDEF)-like protein
MIRTIIRRFGSVGVTLVASLLAVLATIGMTAVYGLLLKGSASQTDLIIGALTSATVSPLVVYWLATLSFELYKSEQRLSALSQKDPLTGAYNRRYFDEHAKVECARAHRYGQALTLLMLDLDLFKEVNDKYGHPAGDEVLKTLVKLGINALRKSDILARYGGEEFVVLLPHAGIIEARMLAERLRKSIEENVIMFDGKSIKATISIGASTLEEQESDISALLARADKALYQAKANGRNRVEVLPTLAI